MNKEQLDKLEEGGRIMERVFIVGKSFTESNRLFGFPPNILGSVDTPGGKLIVFKVINPLRAIYTIVPGYYVSDLPPTEDGLEQIKVRLVPEIERIEVRDFILKNGFPEPINFWDEV